MEMEMANPGMEAGLVDGNTRDATPVPHWSGFALSLRYWTWPDLPAHNLRHLSDVGCSGCVTDSEEVCSSSCVPQSGVLVFAASSLLSSTQGLLPVVDSIANFE